MRRLFIGALLITIMAGPARAEAVSIPLADDTVLKAELFMPSGLVRAPAIVALHGCAGPYAARDNQWRDTLTAQGYMVLLPNSFSSRGLHAQCREKQRVATSDGLRRTDAIASAAWLAARAGTPPGGVALWGWSDGGSTVMAAATAAPDLPSGLIRGFIAFYPGCGVATRNAAWKPVAPMLILMGQADDWTPAKPCQAVADRFTPPLLTMVAYPGAYHDFDAPGGVRVMQNIPTSQNADKSVHAGTDPEARNDAMRRIPAFLESLPTAPIP